MAQALVAYRTARSEADEIFDHHMQQIATALRSGRPLGIPVATIDEPHDEENFDFIVQVWVSGELRVFQSARAALSRQTEPGFSNVANRVTIYRVSSLHANAQSIEVAQDMAARRETTGTLALHEKNLLFGRVRQAFDAQQSFFADAAHELRSPLAALKLQALGPQPAPDNAAREVAVGRLTAGIDRATRLVE